MTLQSSGPISASDIINEFGATRDNSNNPDRTRIGDYRKVSNSPTNTANNGFSNYPLEFPFTEESRADAPPPVGNVPFGLEATSSEHRYMESK